MEKYFALNDTVLEQNCVIRPKLLFDSNNHGNN